jgi:sugar (pentulose or hexulose) kinase
MTALAGLDVGTTAVKAAVFDGDGRVLRSARRLLPRLEIRGPRAWQDLDGVIAAVEAALEDVRRQGPIDRVCLATQRDTVVLVDDAGAALTPLVSWRDRRDLVHGSLWDAFAEEGDVLRGAGSVRSLASHLTSRWVGRAVEAAGTVPRHLWGSALDRVRAVGPLALAHPEVVPVGSAVGAVTGSVLHVCGGDKNCELLGSGVTSAGKGALSLGSAIGLGMLADGSTDPPAGVVLTHASIPGRWNVETGLAGGLEGERFLRDLAPVLPPLASQFVLAGMIAPYFAGALDAPEALPLFDGIGDSTPPEVVHQAWTQGVLCELRRLRPALETAAGSPLEDLVVTGGRAADAAWVQLAADALQLPTRPLADPWAGARGAVAAALTAEPPERSEAFLRRGAALAEPCRPDPRRADDVARYYDRWMALSDVARSRSGQHP